jgi:hypothetical protein
MHNVSLYISFTQTMDLLTVLEPHLRQPLLNTFTRQPHNPSFCKILLVYNAENWNLDAEFIPLHFILKNHRPPDSP